MRTQLDDRVQAAIQTWILSDTDPLVPWFGLLDSRILRADFSCLSLPVGGTWLQHLQWTVTGLNEVTDYKVLGTAPGS